MRLSNKTYRQLIKLYEEDMELLESRFNSIYLASFSDKGLLDLYNKYETYHHTITDRVSLHDFLMQLSNEMTFRGLI